VSSENTITGRLGEHVVGDTQVARLTQWQVTKTLASKTEWGDSDTAGYTARAPGRIDGTFTTEGKYDNSSEVFDLFQPGDIVISVLWMNASLYWDFPRSLNDNFQLTVNIDSQEVIGWTAAWGADGIFYYPGQSGATPRTLPT